MADTLKNFAISAVATAPSPATSGTSLVVTAGHGTRFPAVPFYATVCAAGEAPTPANAEIVRVTGISTDTLTMTRAADSTSVRSIVVGDQIFATLAAAYFLQPHVVTGGTVTVSEPLLNATQTWNDSGVTFTGIKLDVTNTASASASKLIDLQTGGVSQFSVTRAGVVTTGAITVGSTFTVSSYVIGWNDRGAIVARGDGIVGFQNNAGTFFNRLVLGGGITTAYPAIGADNVNGLTLQSGAGSATWNDNSTAASGTVANRYLFGIAAPTLSSTNATVTYTVASSVYIAGAPTNGTNVSIGTAYALNVAAGNVLFGGVLKAGGYQSSDGTAGATGGPWTSVTVKNGLVVSGS